MYAYGSKELMVWPKHTGMLIFIDDVAVAKLFTAQSEETSAFECFIDPSTDGNTRQPLRRACPPITSWIQPPLFHLPI